MNAPLYLNLKNERNLVITRFFWNGLFYKIWPYFCQFILIWTLVKKLFEPSISMQKFLFCLMCNTVLQKWGHTRMISYLACHCQMLQIKLTFEKKDNAFITVWLQIKKLLEYKKLEASYWKKGTSSFMVHSKATKNFI